MTHQLASLGTGGRQTHAEHHIVQTALQQRQQVFTGGAGHFLRHLKVVAELTLQHAVIPLGKLLRPQLLTIFRRLLVPGLTVLAGGIGTAIQGAFAGIATLALQKQFLTFTAAELAHRTSISCHMVIPP